jgi:hypothetical protein
MIAVPAGLVATVGWVLLWILVGLIGLILVLLLIPFHVRAAGQVDDSHWEGSLVARWAWGLVSLRSEGSLPDLYLLGFRVYRFKKRPAKARPKPARRKRPRPGLGTLLRHRRTAFALARRLVHALCLRLRLTGTVGLDDPADTAWLMQLLGRLNRSTPAVHVALEPDWLEERLAVQGAFSARIWPIQFALIGLGAYARRDTRLMLRAASGKAA